MDRLRELRNKKGLSLREMGKELNMSFVTIGQYETGKRQPDNDTLIKLSKYFDVSVDYLLGNTDIRNGFDFTKKEDSDYIKRLLIENGILPKDENLTEEELNKLFKKIADIYKIVKDK